MANIIEDGVILVLDRSIYDRFGEAGLKGQGAGGPGVSYNLYTLSRV